MELNSTSYVVLGMLRHEPRSGYEIKRAVDSSTRFFWAASYGQIYPELRRMAKAGLVEGDTSAGVLASGQVVGVIDDLPSCEVLIDRIVTRAADELLA